MAVAMEAVAEDSVTNRSRSDRSDISFEADVPAAKRVRFQPVITTIHITPPPPISPRRITQPSTPKPSHAGINPLRFAACDCSFKPDKVPTPDIFQCREKYRQLIDQIQNPSDDAFTAHDAPPGISMMRRFRQTDVVDLACDLWASDNSGDPDSKRASRTMRSVMERVNQEQQRHPRIDDSTVRLATAILAPDKDMDDIITRLFSTHSAEEAFRLSSYLSGRYDKWVESWVAANFSKALNGVCIDSFSYSMCMLLASVIEIKARRIESTSGVNIRHEIDRDWVIFCSMLHLYLPVDHWMSITHGWSEMYEAMAREGGGALSIPKQHREFSDRKSDNIKNKDYLCEHTPSPVALLVSCFYIQGSRREEHVVMWISILLSRLFKCIRVELTKILAMVTNAQCRLPALIVSRRPSTPSTPTASQSVSPSPSHSPSHSPPHPNMTITSMSPNLSSSSSSLLTNTNTSTSHDSLTVTMDHSKKNEQLLRGMGLWFEYGYNRHYTLAVDRWQWYQGLMPLVVRSAAFTQIPWGVRPKSVIRHSKALFRQFGQDYKTTRSRPAAAESVEDDHDESDDTDEYDDDAYTDKIEPVTSTHAYKIICDTAIGQYTRRLTKLAATATPSVVLLSALTVQTPTTPTASTSQQPSSPRSISIQTTIHRPPLTTPITPI